MQAFSMYDIKDLDTTVQVLKTTYSFEDWDKIIDQADRLLILAKSAHAFIKLGCASESLNMERSIVFYFGFSHMAKGTAFQKKGLFHEAKEQIDAYANWDWMGQLSDKEQQEADLFTSISKMNLHAINLLMGDLGTLDEYISFLIQNPGEILAGLITILEAANINNLNVDEALSNFSDEMLTLDSSDGIVNMSYMFKYYFQLSLYRIKCNDLRFSLDSVLQAMQLADKMKNGDTFKQCLDLYETYKSHSTPQQEKLYNRIIKGAVRNEKVVSISIASIRNS